MLSVLRALGGYEYRRYRLYERPLVAAATDLRAVATS